MNKKEMIRKWLEENQDKNIWIKQFAYNISIDLSMKSGYKFSEFDEEYFIIEDNNNTKTNIEVILAFTDEDKIDVGYNEETFGREAMDYESDFEIGLEHCLLLFMLK